MKISLHAKKRTMQRLHFKEHEIEEKIITLFNESVEVHHSGIGRAFENKIVNIIFITDNEKTEIITVYPAKGHSLDNEEIIQLNAYLSQTGQIKDSDIRKSIFDSFVKKIDVLNREIIELDCKLRKLEYEISKYILKINKLKDLEKGFELERQKDLKIVEVKLRRSELSEKSTQKSSLINEVQKTLGINLNVYHSNIRKFKHYKLEKEETENETS